MSRFSDFSGNDLYFFLQTNFIITLWAIAHPTLLFYFLIPHAFLHFLFAKEELQGAPYKKLVDIESNDTVSPFFQSRFLEMI